MYQFVGSNALLEIFQSYNRDARKIQSQSIVISSKHQPRGSEKRQDYRGVNTEIMGFQGQLSDPIRLQFFYDKGQVAGFGWLNDTMFCYG